MLLSDRDLLDAIEQGHLEVEPLDKKLLQPCSLDLRLGRQLRVFLPGTEPIDPALDTEPMTKLVELPHYLEPGILALASTHETIKLGRHLAARVEGKSSLGRLGLAVHVTAGFIDPGFSGEVTLELVGMHRTRAIKLYPGMRIAQLSVTPVISKPGSTYGSLIYGSHYQGQRGPTASRAHVGFTHFAVARAGA